MDVLQIVLLIVFAAAVGEGINEFFFLPWFDGFKQPEKPDESEEERKKRLWRETVRVQLMRLWSGFVGIFIAWELSLLVFSLLGAHLRHPLVENILTGLLIGRGSNWIHELLKKFVNSVKDKALVRSFYK